MNKKCNVLLVLTFVFLVSAALVYSAACSFRVTKLNYTETQKVAYKVYLTDKSYYGKDYLEEGMQYISSIIDYIDVSYKYNVKFDKKVDFLVDSNVVANIKFVDINNENNVIYTSQETLDTENFTKKDEKTIEIIDNIKIDYKQYNQIANKFKTNYGVSANCKLIVEFYVDYNASYNGKNKIDNGSIGRLEIPLSKQMITLDKTADINVNSFFELENINASQIKNMMSLTICLSIITLIILILFVREVLILNKNKDKYESHIKKILRQYDSYITESKIHVKVDGKTIIRCENFKELMDVRNNIEKAIIFERNNNESSRFLMIDDDVVYIYQVRAKDF